MCKRYMFMYIYIMLMYINVYLLYIYCMLLHIVAEFVFGFQNPLVGGCGAWCRQRALKVWNIHIVGQTEGYCVGLHAAVERQEARCGRLGEWGVVRMQDEG